MRLKLCACGCGKIVSNRAENAIFTKECAVKRRKIQQREQYRRYNQKKRKR